jgi:hypothetical protein
MCRAFDGVPAAPRTDIEGAHTNRHIGPQTERATAMARRCSHYSIDRLIAASIFFMRLCRGGGNYGLGRAGCRPRLRYMHDILTICRNLLQLEDVLRMASHGFVACCQYIHMYTHTHMHAPAWHLPTSRTDGVVVNVVSMTMETRRACVSMENRRVCVIGVTILCTELP